MYSNNFPKGFLARREIISLRKHAYAICISFFKAEKMIFLDENNIVFLVFAQNIDRGYTLEPPQ